MRNRQDSVETEDAGQWLCYYDMCYSSFTFASLELGQFKKKLTP